MDDITSVIMKPSILVTSSLSSSSSDTFVSPIYSLTSSSREFTYTYYVALLEELLAITAKREKVLVQLEGNFLKE